MRSALADRLHRIAVADSILDGINRIYDTVDGGFARLDRLFNWSPDDEEPAPAARTRSKRTPKVIDVQAVPAQAAQASVQVAAQAPAPVSPTASPKPARKFRIIEAIAPSTGSTIFVVTNGRERAECSTRALAEKLFASLGAK